MRRALIVANSRLPPLAVLEPWLKRAHRVIAADGGANRAVAVGFKVHDVVGDMDSVRPGLLRSVAGQVVEDLDPDHTDLEKAIGFAYAGGYRDVTVVGASRGRLDHVLAAFAVIMEWGRRVKIRWVDEQFTAEPVVGRVSFRSPVGTVVSLFAPDVARGVSTRGLRWELRGETLRRGTRGIHNQVRRNPVSVKVERGDLLLLRGHWVEPHR